MMPRPLVSVVIPCFNSEAFVGDAVESALSQTYESVEVIVVDDGSMDSSLDVIKKFGSRVRVEVGNHAGACAARNRGIEVSNGELIQFLDADDLLEPWKLTVQVPLMEEGTADIVIGGWTTYPVGHPESAITARASIISEDPVVFALFKIPFICNPIHWKWKLLDIGGFRTEIPCAHDYDLLLRLACRGITVSRVEEQLFVRRTVPGSISSDGHRMLRQFREVLWNSYRGLEASSGLGEGRRRAFAACMAGKARAMVRLGLEEEAIKMFDDALSMSPQTGWTEGFGAMARPLARLLGPVRGEKMVLRAKSLLGRGGMHGTPE